MIPRPPSPQGRAPSLVHAHDITTTEHSTPINRSPLLAHGELDAMTLPQEQIEHEVVGKIPTEYLEAYPFPAFVLRVRAATQAAQPPQPLSPGADTITLATSGDEDTSNESGSASAMPASTSGSGDRIPKMGTITNISKHPAAIRVAPVSAPLTSFPPMVWSNNRWARISQGWRLEELVGRHALAAFQEWAEGDYVVGTLTPSTSSVFGLELDRKISPPLAIEFVKSRRPLQPGATHTYVILTAIAPGRERDVSSPAASQNTALPVAPPTAIAGPTALHNSSLPPTTHSVMFTNRPTRNVQLADEARKHIYTQQCHLLIDEVDWSKTPAGPREQWAPEIKAMVGVAFSSFTQDVVYIGPEHVMCYNQAYSVLVDHPKCFGLPLAVAWAPLFSALKPFFDRAMAGEPIHHENDLILHQRNDRGRFVERYQTFSLIPIVGADQKVVGVYNPSLDTTAKVLAERRLDTTRDIVERLSLARTSREYYEALADVTERCPAEAPFLLCYSVKERARQGNNTERSQSMSTPVPETPGDDDEQTIVDLVLETTVGVPAGHPGAPNELTLSLPKSTRASFMPTNDPLPSPDVGTETPQRPDPIPHQPASVKEYSIPAHPSPIPHLGSPSSASGTPPLWAHSRPNVRRTLQVDGPSTTWPIALALSTRQCVVVDDCSQIVQGFTLRHWEELPDMAIVIPVSSEASADIPPAVIILGLNVYRPLDSDYEDWIQVIRGHIGVALTSVLAYEEEWNRRAEREKLERAKATLFRASAHEFRSPLTLIAGPLEDLEDTELSPQQRQKLTLAVRNVHRLQGLVSSMLDFSRMEAGQVTTRFTPIELGAFVSEIVAFFRPATERLKVQLAVDIEPRNQPVNVDSALMEMVVCHLLVNALKYTETGIRVELHYDAEHAFLSVTDTGNPIVGSDNESVTDWVQRAQTTLDAFGADGAVVGLALAREIMRLHGGQLLIKSVPPDTGSESAPHGMTLVARIPLNRRASEQVAGGLVPLGAFSRQTAKEVVSWIPNGDAVTADSASSASGISFGGALVFERSDVLLVVDEDRDEREYIKLVFAPFCTVVEAASGPEAVALALANPPDLVLCDLLMRQMGGLEVLCALRDQEPTKFVPFVVTSAASDDNSRVEAYLAGVDDYLPKPFHSKELLLRVHLHMQLGKKRAKLEQLFSEQILEVERRRIEAEESKQHQEFLVDLISHEIRTPVSAILQCASLVKENLVALREQLRFSSGGFYPSPALLNDLEEDVGALDSIYQCGLVQERIAGDVLSLASLQRQMLSFHDLDMDIHRESRKMLSVFSSEARMKRVDLSISFGSSFDRLGISIIRTDPVRVGQVVSNLISNAIRFTQISATRLVNVHYDVSVRPPEPGTHVPPLPNASNGKFTPLDVDTPIYLYISVSDSGPGISAAERARLFKGFHQGNKMIHTRFGGSGLGLFICKSIAELLGGGITVVSEVGIGSTFHVYLRVTVGALAETPSPTAPTKAATLPPSSPGEPPLISPSALSDYSSEWLAAAGAGYPPLHVLVVEDNIINQTVLKRQLVKAGFQCDTANNGQEALVLLHEGNRRARYGGAEAVAYHVVLMDLEMPIMDGLTAVKHIREAERDGLLRPQLVIALTGNARQGQKENALAAGMNDVVIKPYRLPDLITKMRTAADAFSRRRSVEDWQGGILQDMVGLRLKMTGGGTPVDTGDLTPGSEQKSPWSLSLGL